MKWITQLILHMLKQVTIHLSARIIPSISYISTTVSNFIQHNRKSVAPHGFREGKWPEVCCQQWNLMEEVYCSALFWLCLALLPCLITSNACTEGYKSPGEDKLDLQDSCASIFNIELQFHRQWLRSPTVLQGNEVSRKGSSSGSLNLVPRLRLLRRAQCLPERLLQTSLKPPCIWIQDSKPTVTNWT